MSGSTRQGDLPDGWVWTTIGQIADTTRKRVNPQNHPALPFVGMEHVESHTMRITTTVSSKDMRSRAEYFEPGDVLYGRLRPYLNKVFCAEFTGLCSGEFIPFRKTNHVASKYLLYFLNSWEFVSFASHLNEGDRPRVSFDQLANYPFPLAPLPEQQRIVAAIETHFTRLDAAVTALQRVQANLRRYRAAVLKAACAGRLVPSEAALARQAGRTYEPADVLLARILAERRARWEAEHPGKRYVEPAGPCQASLPALPEGWVWATVDQLISHLTSGSRGWANRYAPDGPLFIRAQDINTDELRLDNAAHVTAPNSIEAQRTRIQKYDLLVTITGANVTRSAMVRHDIGEAYVSQHVALVRPRVEKISQYLYLWIISPLHGRRQLITLSYGAGKPGLNLPNLRELSVAIPPLAEQQRIVAEVERRLSVVAEVEAAVAANLQRASRLRQAILKQAFAGRLGC